MTRNDDERRTDPCSGCRADRRGFLREAAVAAINAFIVLGATRRDAVAFPIRLITGASQGPIATYPVPEADGATIDLENDIIIARYQGSVFAFDLSCPHQRTALKWHADDNRFQCPKHKSKYQPDGTFISGRATRNMDRHPIRLEGGKLVVELEVVIRSDKDPAVWEAAAVKPGG